MQPILPNTFFTGLALPVWVVDAYYFNAGLGSVQREAGGWIGVFANSLVQTTGDSYPKFHVIVWANMLLATKV